MNVGDVAINFETVELPSSWGVVAVSDALTDTKFRVGKVNREKYLPAGALPIIDQSQTFVAGYTDDLGLAFDGQLPVIVFGDHTRILKFVGFRFVCGADGTKVLTPDAGVFDPEFLFYALCAVDLPSRGYNRHFSFLREKALPRPGPEEQRAIAFVLRSVQQAREATEAVVRAAQAVKRSLLHRLIKSAPGMESKTLGELAELTNGKAFKASDWGQSGLPIIRIQNLNDRAAPFNYYAGPIEERYLVSPGDLLFAWSGSKGTSFGSHTWMGQPGLLNQHIFRVQPRDDSVRLDYLAFVLEGLTSEIESAAYGLAALVHVRKPDLAATAIPLPPVDIQREIASSLHAADRKVAAEVQRRDALDELFKSLLHELMTGKRRVSPDLVKGVAEVSA